MANPIIFEIGADTSKLEAAAESTIKFLERIGALDKKNADAFRAASDIYSKSIASINEGQARFTENASTNARGIDLLTKALKDLGVNIPKGQLKDFADGVLLGIQDAMQDVGTATKGTTKNLTDLANAVKNSGGKNFVSNFIEEAGNISKTSGKVLSLKERLIDAKTEAQELAARFGEDSVQAIAAQRNVGKLTGELQKFNERVRGFNTENKFQTIAATFQGIAGSIAIASGTLSLFGEDVKEAEAITKKLDAALKITAGLSAVSQLGGQFKNLGIALGLLQSKTALTAAATTTLAEAEIAAGVGGEAAAAGTTAFSTALKASPLGIFLVVLTAAAAAYVLLSDSATEAEKAQEKLNQSRTKAIQDTQTEVQQVRVLVEEYKNSNTTKERQAEILKQLQESYPNYFAQLSQEKSSVEDITKAYTKLTEALVVKAQIDALVDQLAENRNKKYKLEHDNILENASILNKIVSIIDGGQSAFISQRKEVEKTDKEYKDLLGTVVTLQKTLDTLGGDPDKKPEKPQKVKKTKEIEDDLKAIEQLRKKELAADLDNLKIWAAARKTEINNSNISEEEKVKALAALELAQLNLRLLYYQQYGEEVGGVLNEIADFQIKASQAAAAASKKETEDLFKQWEIETQDFIDKEEKKKELQKKFEKERNEIIIQAGAELLNGYFDLEAQKTENAISEIQKRSDAQLEGIDKELAANQRKRDTDQISQREFVKVEAELIAKRADAEVSAQKKINDLKHKQDVANRRQKLFEIALSTFRNIAENPLLAIFYAALGAAQSVAVLAKPLPEYAKGTLSLQRGNNPAGVDTIPIMANAGEAITPTDKARDYAPTLKAIHSGAIPAIVLNEYAKSYSVKKFPMFGSSTTTNNVGHEIDYDKLARAIAWETRNNSTATQRGLKEIAEALRHQSPHQTNFTAKG